MGKTSRSFLFLILSIAISIAISLATLGEASAHVDAVIGSVAIKDNANLAGAMPTSDQSEIIISREQYVISYNKERRAPNWVAWKLEANQMGSSGRSNNFLMDADLTAYLSQSAPSFQAVDPSEYLGSCFDRGHQIPSADRTDTMANNQMTFLMSNMIPQTPYLNRVIWEHLEDYTRQLVHQGKKVYVIAGPIYDEVLGSIGPAKNIPVPSKDFKIIVALDANQSPQDINANTPIIAVIMPNVLKDGSKPLDHNKLCGDSSITAFSGPADLTDWEQYKTSLSEIEKASGLGVGF